MMEEDEALGDAEDHESQAAPAPKVKSEGKEDGGAEAEPSNAPTSPKQIPRNEIRQRRRVILEEIYLRLIPRSNSWRKKIPFPPMSWVTPNP